MMEQVPIINDGFARTFGHGRGSYKEVLDAEGLERLLERYTYADKSNRPALIRDIAKHIRAGCAEEKHMSLLSNTVLTTIGSEEIVIALSEKILTLERAYIPINSLLGWGSSAQCKQAVANAVAQRFTAHPKSIKQPYIDLLKTFHNEMWKYPLLLDVVAQCWKQGNTEAENLALKWLKYTKNHNDIAYKPLLSQWAQQLKNIDTIGDTDTLYAWLKECSNIAFEQEMLNLEGVLAQNIAARPDEDWSKAWKLVCDTTQAMPAVKEALELNAAHQIVEKNADNILLTLKSSDKEFSERVIIAYADKVATSLIKTSLRDKIIRKTRTIFPDGITPGSAIYGLIESLAEHVAMDADNTTYTLYNVAFGEHSNLNDHVKEFAVIGKTVGERYVQAVNTLHAKPSLGRLHPEIQARNLMISQATCLIATRMKAEGHKAVKIVLGEKAKEVGAVKGRQAIKSLSVSDWEEMLNLSLRSRKRIAAGNPPSLPIVIRENLHQRDGDVINESTTVDKVWLDKALLQDLLLERLK